MKNLTSSFLFLSLGVALASACGGNSTSFTNGAGGSSGKGGSGGSGGKGGSAGAATGGSGGSSGSSGTTGGSGGKGGSSTGGSSGKGGKGGTGTGGTGEAGEPGTGGTGGSAMAGTGGMAGTGAMTGYDPPDTQVDGCTLMCAAAVEAMCENGDSLAQCQQGCRFGIQLEACSDQWDDFFECTGDSEPECDGNGEVTWPECVAEYAAVIGCAYGDAMDPDFDAPCEGFCDAQDGLMCTSSVSNADCRNECGLVGAAVPVCKQQYLAYLACAGDAEFMCDENGDPQPEGCVQSGLPFLACVVTEYGVTF
jgi:hypothetical protein